MYKYLGPQLIGHACWRKTENKMSPVPEAFAGLVSSAAVNQTKVSRPTDGSLHFSVGLSGHCHLWRMININFDSQR